MQAPVELWRRSNCVFFFLGWRSVFRKIWNYCKCLPLKLLAFLHTFLGAFSSLLLFRVCLTSFLFFLFFFRCLRSSGLFVSDCCCGLVTFFLLYVCVFSPPQTHLSLFVFFLFLKAPGFPVGFLFLLWGCLTSIDISTSCSFGL